MIKLNGSEKQIAWAEDLRTNIVKCIDAIVDGNRNHPMYAQYKEQADAVIAVWEDRKVKLLGCSSAAAIIDYFQSLKFTGDINADVTSVNAIYTVTLNNGYKFK